jgi:hypothetical protein
MSRQQRERVVVSGSEEIASGESFFVSLGHQIRPQRNAECPMKCGVDLVGKSRC